MIISSEPVIYLFKHLERMLCVAITRPVGTLFYELYKNSLSSDEHFAAALEYSHKPESSQCVFPKDYQCDICIPLTPSEPCFLLGLVSPRAEQLHDGMPGNFRQVGG